MSDEIFDRFESLTPSGRQDVPVAGLSKLLKVIPEPSEETRIAINLIDQFENATRLRLPSKNGIHLWLGYCVGAFHEVPRREEFFLFAIQRSGESVKGHATGIEDDKQPKLPKLRTSKDLDKISGDDIQELVFMLNNPPENSKLSDWFSPVDYATDGPSIVFSPRLSARYFMRQSGEKLLFVQPSRCGGWYGELWPKAL